MGARAVSATGIYFRAPLPVTYPLGLALQIQWKFEAAIELLRDATSCARPTFDRKRLVNTATDELRTSELETRKGHSVKSRANAIDRNRNLFIGWNLLERHEPPFDLLHMRSFVNKIKFEAHAFRRVLCVTALTTRRAQLIL
jgi:hypothetical protein